MAPPARGVARGHPRRTAPRHLAARRAVRAPVRAGCSPSRRSRPTSPGASTSCCATSTASTCRASSRSPSSAGGSRRDGTELDACLVTRHLQFSLPYRALYSQSLRKGTATRLIDALAVLLVRLHLAGFWWGDVSLSNTLFRRDAGAFAAYLVDAETGELHQRLSDGQREHDLEIARVNIAGELMDLEAGGLLQEDRDPVVVERADRRPLPRAVGRPHRQRAHRRAGALARRRPHPAPQRARLRRRRAGHHAPTSTARRSRSSPRSSTRATTHGGCCGSPASTSREPGPPPAQRPRRLHGRDRAPGRGRGDRRPRLAGQRSTSR